MARTTTTRTGGTSRTGTPPLYGDIVYPSGYGEGQSPFSFDPLEVSKNIGQYYTTSLAQQPGYQAILRNIAGKLQPQTIYNIGQAAAERGIGIGSYGGGNDETAYLRAIGLNTQDLINTGLQQYGAAYSAVPAIRPDTLYMSPQQREQLRLEWEMQQARLAAEAARQAETIAAQERLARINQQTSWGNTGWNINANREMFDINRADTLAARAALQNSITKQLGDIAASLSPVTTPTGAAQTPAYDSGAVPDYWAWPSGYTGSATGLGVPGSGSVYMGPQIGSPEQEWDVLWGVTPPETLGIGPSYLQPGEDTLYYE